MTGLLHRRDLAEPGHRRSWRWGIGAAALVVLVLGWVIAFSSVLGVRTVTVSGSKLLSSDQVLAAAAVRDGSPLIRLDTSAIEKRVEALPEVRSARVSRSYPSSVRITVVERVAVGYHVNGTSFALVDAGDVDIRTVKSAPTGIPRLDQAGDRARSDAVAAVAGALPAAVVAKVSSITAPTAESITLSLADGRTVMWGGTDHDTDKAQLLPTLLGQPGQYFDISDPTAVISRSG